MKNEIKKKKSEKAMGYIVALILGVFLFLVGVLVFQTKLFGTRGFGVVEGSKAQIGGIILILVGLYAIIASIRKLRLKIRNRKR